MDQDQNQLDLSVKGSIEIAPEVIEVIAGTAALEVAGVSAMSGGFVKDIREKLGGKKFRKGIHVEVGPEGVEIDVSVVIDYRSSIPHIAGGLQHSVKRAVERMTSLTVTQVNVYVNGVEQAMR